MYSTVCAAPSQLPRLLLPLVEGQIPAGFPSPPEDFATNRHNLNESLITHPLATFFWQVSDDSMREAGIFDSNILVVNRALRPAHRSVKLVPANPTFPEILFKEGQQLIICGVVTCSIKRFTK